VSLVKSLKNVIKKMLNDDNVNLTKISN